MSAGTRRPTHEAPDRGQVPRTAAEASRGDVPPVTHPAAESVVRRLRLVEGQVHGLIKMVESGRSTPEVMTQLSAAYHALHKVGLLILAEELHRDDEGGPEEAARFAAIEKLFMTLG
jgi:DNA-binding FrmR family transcriptional regulator